MFREIILRFNPIDLIVVGIFLYQWGRSWRGRLFDEIFGNIAHLFGAFLACHYYNDLSGVILKSFEMPASLAKGLSFIVIWASIVALFALIKQGWAVMLGVELKRDRMVWLRVGLGLVKSTLIVSLFVYSLAVFQWGAVKDILPRSFATAKLGPLAPRIYKVWTRIIVERLFPNETVNEDVDRVLDRLAGKNTDEETL